MRVRMPVKVNVSILSIPTLWALKAIPQINAVIRSIIEPFKESFFTSHMISETVQNATSDLIRAMICEIKGIIGQRRIRCYPI